VAESAALVAHERSRLRTCCRFDLARLRTAIKPFRLHWFPTLRSTNDHAAALRERGTLYAPSVVLTGRQTAGRGRGMHSWWSAAGCLTVTFVLPIEEAVQPHQLPLLAGIAVRRAVEKLLLKPEVQAFGARPSSAGLSPTVQEAAGNGRAPKKAAPVDVQLKWPNDVLCDGRKLGGLLCERVRRADLVGLGLNVNLDPADTPADIRNRVTSLCAIARRAFDMTNVLARVTTELHQIIQQLPQTPFPSLLKEYDQHHALIGRQVSVFDAGDGRAITGKCEGLDAMGRLLLRDGRTLCRVIAGQVVAK